MADDVAPAAAHPATAARLAGMRRVAWALLVGGIAATALAVTVLRAEARTEAALRASLVPATGTVEAVVPAGMLDSGALVVEVDGRSVRVPADLERESWAPDDPVSLLLSPDDPTTVRRADLAGGGGAGVLVVVVLLGPAVALVGAVAVRREAGMRRILRTHPWRTIRARPATRPGRLLRVDLVTDAGPLAVEPTPRWLLAPLRTAGTRTYWVAGPSDGRQVVSTPRLETLVGVRPAARDA